MLVRVSLWELLHAFTLHRLIVHHSWLGLFVEHPNWLFRIIWSISLCWTSCCFSVLLKLNVCMIKACPWWLNLLCLPWLGIGGNDLQVHVRSVSIMAGSSWSMLFRNLAIRWTLRFFGLHQLLTAQSLQSWLNGFILYRLLILYEEGFVAKVERVEDSQLEHLILLSIERFRWTFRQNVVVGLLSEGLLLTRWALWSLCRAWGLGNIEQSMSLWALMTLSWALIGVQMSLNSICIASRAQLVVHTKEASLYPRSHDLKTIIVWAEQLVRLAASLGIFKIITISNSLVFHFDASPLTFSSSHGALSLFLMTLIHLPFLLIDLVLEHFHLHALAFLEVLLINLDSVVDVVGANWNTIALESGLFSVSERLVGTYHSVFAYLFDEEWLSSLSDRALTRVKAWMNICVAHILKFIWNLTLQVQNGIFSILRNKWCSIFTWCNPILIHWDHSLLVTYFWAVQKTLICET